MDKHIFIRKYWEEEGITYYIHFFNNYAVRQIEVTGNRILRFSADEHDFLCDQPLDILEDIDKQDIISEQEFELV